MKTTKRLLSCLLVLAMLFALAIPAFADETADTSKTGVITIENAVRVDDGSYTAYKIFNATVATDRNPSANPAVNDGITYTLLDGQTAIPEALQGVFELVNGQVKVKKINDVEVSAQDVAAAVMAYAKTLTGGQTGNYVEGTNNYQITGLDAGYYAVVPSANIMSSEAAVGIVITSLNPSVTIEDKNLGGTPTIPQGDKLKKIDAAAADDKIEVDTTNDTASVDGGAAVPFVVTFIAKNNIQDKSTNTRVGVYEYTVVDNPVNLKIDWENVTVTVDEKTLVRDTDYTVDANKNTVTIKWANYTENLQGNKTIAQSLYSDGATVTVKYSGTIIDQTKAASNNAKINYNGENPAIPEEDKEPEVYTSTIAILKHETGNESKVLKDAKFILYREVTTPGTDAKTKEYYHLSNGVVTWGAKDDAYEVTTDEDGTAKFVGLKDGTYFLEETAAPNGYNMMTEAKEVSVKATKGTNDAWVLTMDAKVGNARGTVLPSTGGIGTTMFYVIGGLMVAAAVVVLVSKKRMGAEQ